MRVSVGFNDQVAPSKLSHRAKRTMGGGVVRQVKLAVTSQKSNDESKAKTSKACVTKFKP